MVTLLFLLLLVLIPPLTHAQVAFDPCSGRFPCTAPKNLCRRLLRLDLCYCSTPLYGPTCSERCGGFYLASTTERFITSPYFPAIRQELFLCTWSLAAPPGYEVVLTFNDFLIAPLANRTNCPYGYVKIGTKYFCEKNVPPEIRGTQLKISYRNTPFLMGRGFNATYKAVPSDPCLSHSCKNGTCQAGTNSYTCLCLPGFTGSRCEVDVDECESTPCRYGGSCQNGVNSFTCVCPTGFSGPTCEVGSYSLTYCFLRPGRGVAGESSVTLTLTGSAGSSPAVTLPSGLGRVSCLSGSLSSPSLGQLLGARVSLDPCGGGTQTACPEVLGFQLLSARLGRGPGCAFSAAVWAGAAGPRTLAAACPVNA